MHLTVSSKDHATVKKTDVTYEHLTARTSSCSIQISNHVWDLACAFSVCMTKWDTWSFQTQFFI